MADYTKNANIGLKVTQKNLIQNYRYIYLLPSCRIIVMLDVHN